MDGGSSQVVPHPAEKRIDFDEYISPETSRMLRQRWLEMFRLPNPNDSRNIQYKINSEQNLGTHTVQRIEIQDDSGAISVIMTLPNYAKERLPAVICLHGHDNWFMNVYTHPEYDAFADKLARQGYVTAALDIGRHDPAVPLKEIQSERLYHLIRTVDLLHQIPQR